MSLNDLDISSVLHPSYRLSWFEDKDRWDSAGLAARVRVTVTSKYSEYAERHGTGNSGAEASGESRRKERQPLGLLAQTICSSRASHTANLEELDSYFRGTFPCDRYDDVLHWWKVSNSPYYLPESCFLTNVSQKHESTFPILARMACDILAIPGVSISVERLFSVCRHVITEARCSMTANTARMTICAKEWLREGLGDEIVSLAS